MGNFPHSDQYFKNAMEQANFRRVSQVASGTVNRYRVKKEQYVLDHIFYLKISNIEYNSSLASRNDSFKTDGKKVILKNRNKNSLGRDPASNSLAPRWGEIASMDISDHACVATIFPNNGQIIELFFH